MNSPHRPTQYKRFVPYGTYQNSVFSKISFVLETMADDIIVVEIKMDNDVSDEKKAKLRYS